ncbi:hypothetical protein [Enterobacter hormaechei]|uniref:hypothetical protein n=1 Tax=Enterobacter hormaechei TaxID=158836 RepID=UPI003D36A8EC
MRVPKWYAKGSSAERLEFLLAIAACHASPTCSLQGLAEKLELTPFVFGHWKRKGTVPVNRAQEIERLVGRDVVRWECLVSPDMSNE